jgi:carboxyl-terminal processing protease
MTRHFRVLIAFAAAWLLSGGGAHVAAAQAVSEELLAPLASVYMQAIRPGEEAALHLELYRAVLEHVEFKYVRKVDVTEFLAAAIAKIEPLEPHTGDPAEVFERSINAALASLDPHSRYIDPQTRSRERTAAFDSYGGLGLEVNMVEGVLRVIATLPGTPAERAGLKSGDLIVRLDEQPVLGMPIDAAVARLRGEPGTPVVLTIQRTGDAGEFNVSLVRETARSPALSWSTEGEVLVLRLSSFTGAVAAAIETAVADAIATQPPRGIVLDLRGNLGGSFREAVKTADAFLGEGEIGSLEGRSFNRRTWRADTAQLLGGVPMVVLIDQYSASATELVAAALQDNGRATILGQRSCGKGSVQDTIALGRERGVLRLTTTLYYGPSGRLLQRTGVSPDIELMPAPQTTAEAGRREADRPRALPGADEPPPPKARVEESRCAATRANTDPALACALAFLEAGDIGAFLMSLEVEKAAAR